MRTNLLPVAPVDTTPVPLRRFTHRFARGISRCLPVLVLSGLPAIVAAAPLSPWSPAQSGATPAASGARQLDSGTQPPEPTQPPDLDIDPAVHRRMLQMVAGLPTCTLIRLDEQGLPQVQMDIYFGLEGPQSTETLLDFAESFEFGFDESERSKTRAGVLDPASRTIVIPTIKMPAGEPDATFFAPEKGIAVAFRPVLMNRMNLSCYQSWAVAFNGYDHTAVDSYWQVRADGVAGVAQARRDRNANPQLYLYRWNGSSWALVDSSRDGAWMDHVRHYSSSCSSSDYLVRVWMSNEGYYSCFVSKFSASN